MERKNKINLADIAQVTEIAKQNPQYTQLLYNLVSINQLILKYAKDCVENYSDPDIYYIKTEFDGTSYDLLLYNIETDKTLGVSWLLADFLEQCQDKRIEYSVDTKIKRMLKQFDINNLQENTINWLDN